MTDYILKLPPPTTPKLTYKAILDGSEYRFYFNYLSRGDSSWHLSIYDNQDQPLALNLKLVPWFDLLSGLPQGRLPKGSLGIVCISQPDPFAPEITLDNLSTDFIFLYSSVT